ncbi:hypothetical protein HZS_292 [Henneguya salminicola]|nr:hypothetical protein HZS_292 [Henneguya salminicola]
MDVIVLTANSDNYMYILIDKAANTAAAIDPFDYRKIIKTVETHKINLTHILTTHHHW